MLSDNCYKQLHSLFKQATLFCATPVKWEKRGKGNRGQLVTSPWTLFTFTQFTIAVHLYTAFMIVQSIRWKLKGLENTIQYYFLFGLMLWGPFFFIFIFQILRKREELRHYFDEWFRYLEEIQSQFMKSRNPNTCLENRYCDLMIYFLGKVMPLTGFLISLHCHFYPDWPVYLTSLVPPEQLKWYMRVAFSIVFWYGHQSAWAILQIVVVIFLLNIWYMLILLKEFHCDDGRPLSKRIVKGHQANNRFREFETIKYYYLQLEILHIVFLDIVAIIFMPMNIVTNNVALFCNFNLIRDWQNINFSNRFVLLVWSVFSSFALLVGFGFLGDIRRKGKRVLISMRGKHWGSRMNNRCMAKFLRGRKPLCYSYRRMYIIKRTSVLKFIKSVTRGTFRALLAIKK